MLQAREIFKHTAQSVLQEGGTEGRDTSTTAPSGRQAIVLLREEKELDSEHCCSNRDAIACTIDGRTTEVQSSVSPCWHWLA